MVLPIPVFFLSHGKLENLPIDTHVDVLIFFILWYLPFMAVKKDIIELVIADIDLYIINTVRSFRVQKEISQVQLSQDIGMSDGFVGKVENPRLRDKYNFRHLNLLAKVLGCSPKDFLPEKSLPQDLVRLKVKMVRQPVL